MPTLSDRLMLWQHVAMFVTKRHFLKAGGAVAGAALIAPACTSKADRAKQKSGLQSITGDAVPIDVPERLARIEKAQRLMAEHGIDALLLEPGSAMLYFAGISWWRSERLTAVVISRTGDIGVVTPYFEEPSVRESMTFGDDVRTWNEHEDPFERVAGILADRGLKDGRIGFEDTVRKRVPARDEPAANTRGGQDRAHGLWLYRPRLSLGHLAHVRAR